MSRNLNPTFRGQKLLLSGFVLEGTRVVLTTPDTLTDNDYKVATNLTVAGAVALTGPSNAGVGMRLVIYDQKGDAGTNNVTFTPAAGETVEGAATLVINVNYGCVEIEKESSTNWKVVSRTFMGGGSMDLSSPGPIGATTPNTAVFTKGTITPGVATSGVPTAFTVTGAADTGQTASTEKIDFYYNGARTVTWATGAITTQRFALFKAPTLAFAGASTVTKAATLAIDRAPQAGANATLTNAYALWVQAGKTQLDGDLALGAAASLSFAAGAGGIDASLLTGALKFGASTATLGFFGATAAARPTAYTQTYATADRTHANPTMATLTDSSGGTAADTIAAITTGGAAADQAPTRNAIATLAREQARAVADIADVKQLLNSVIDDLQTLGLLQ